MALVNGDVLVASQIILSAPLIPLPSARAILAFSLGSVHAIIFFQVLKGSLEASFTTFPGLLAKMLNPGYREHALKSMTYPVLCSGALD